jgi:hypothetical protein
MSPAIRWCELCEIKEAVDDDRLCGDCQEECRLAESGEAVDVTMRQRNYDKKLTEGFDRWRAE